jgi:hypothetical protein
MDAQKSNLNNDEYILLYRRVLKMKMDGLFSEPYDGDMDEEED